MHPRRRVGATARLCGPIEQLVKARSDRPTTQIARPERIAVINVSAVVDATGRLEPGSSTAIVPWWSFTKTLIATAALCLAQDGCIALGEPVPGCPYALRALLQHRTGIGDYGNLPEYHEAVARGDEPWPDSEVFARIPPPRLLFPPGTGWAYSNVGYLIIRRLIEATCGADLADVLRLRVMEPLGLTASCLAQTRADMCRTVFEGGHFYHPGWVFHGTIIGPVAEAALALHRLLHGDLLTLASRAAMLDAHPIGGPLPGRPWLTTGYGLGLMMGTMRRPGMAAPLQVAGHTAGGPGSVGAIYQRSGDNPPHTVAVFASGADQGLVEDKILRKLLPAIGTSTPAS
jgi:CubicO group peptidase (beta-lactamase class C family)